MRKNSRILAVILGISVLLRVAASLKLGNTVEILPGTFDQLSYHRLALRVVGGHGFSFGELWWPLTQANAPTAHWSYLYTLYLTLVYAIFGPNPLAARLIQAVAVGAAMPYLTYRLGKHLFTARIGLAAAGISAVYTYFIYYAATLMTESFYITAILGGLYLAILLVKANQNGNRAATRKYTLLLGLTLGATVLLRQLYLLFVPFLFLWVWWGGRKTGQKSLIPALAGVGALIVLMIVPFTIYNTARFGQFVLLNTNAGFAFFWGNHPIYGSHFIPILPEGTYQELIPDDLRHLDEAALEKELLKRGLQFIIAEPGRYLKLSVSRIPPYFMFWPSAQSGMVSNLSRVFSFGIFWPFMLAGLIYAPFSHFLREKLRLESPLTLIYLFVVIYAVIHILTWTLIRYRLPMDAMLVIFAALPLVWGWEKYAAK